MWKIANARLCLLLFLLSSSSRAASVCQCFSAAVLWLLVSVGLGWGKIWKSNSERAPHRQDFHHFFLSQSFCSTNSSQFTGIPPSSFRQTDVEQFLFAQQLRLLDNALRLRALT